MNRSMKLSAAAVVATLGIASGAHAVITSARPQTDIAFFRDVLKLPSVDDGGYVIFSLPSAEVSLHEADTSDRHELFLMCSDVKAFIAEMAKRGIPAPRSRTRAGAYLRRSRRRAAASFPSISRATSAQAL